VDEVDDDAPGAPPVPLLAAATDVAAVVPPIKHGPTGVPPATLVAPVPGSPAPPNGIVHGITWPAVHVVMLSVSEYAPDPPDWPYAGSTTKLPPPPPAAPVGPTEFVFVQSGGTVKLVVPAGRTIVVTG
jgi:hypothetical protein